MKVAQDEFLDLLQRSGLALYGERWKAGIAKPDEVLPKLLVLLEQRHQQTGDLIADINRGINS